MHFEIRFPNGERVPLATLNAEAGNLWRLSKEMVDYHNREHTYITPPKIDTEESNNYTWHSVIGEAIIRPNIARKEPMQPNWADIRETLFNDQMDGGDTWEDSFKEMQAKIISTVKYLKSYYELVDLWESKGYIPIKTK